MVEYWKSLKKYYCIYCKMFLLDNPANRRHHELGEKHKQKMKGAIDQAKMAAGGTASQTSGSFYEDHNGKGKMNEERVFPGTKREFQTSPSLQVDPISPFLRVQSLPVPEVITKRVPNASISFSFKPKIEPKHMHSPTKDAGVLAEDSCGSIQNDIGPTVLSKDSLVEYGDEKPEIHLSTTEKSPKDLCSNEVIDLLIKKEPLSSKSLPMFVEPRSKTQRTTMASDEEDE